MATSGEQFTISPSIGTSGSNAQPAMGNITPVGEPAETPEEVPEEPPPPAPIPEPEIVPNGETSVRHSERRHKPPVK